MSIEELKELQQKIIKINKKYNKIAATAAIITLIIVLITICIMIIKSSDLVFIPFIMIFILIIILIITGAIKTNKIKDDCEVYIKEYKKIFILEALKKHFTDVVYEPEKGFTEDFIKNTHMISTGDSYESNDYISGKYKDINFSQSDIHIEEEEEEEDSEGNKETYWVTIFLGRWMIFDFNKPFKSNVQIITDGFAPAGYEGGEGYDEVSMEESEFNKKFSVYAQDAHEAFYILTPHFMEKLKRINEKLGKYMMFCFIDNKLHIALYNDKDSFEPDIFKEINVKEEEEKISNEITIITDLIDDLRLDNDLFRREV